MFCDGKKLGDGCMGEREEEISQRSEVHLSSLSVFGFVLSWF